MLRYAMAIQTMPVEPVKLMSYIKLPVHLVIMYGRFEMNRTLFFYHQEDI